MKLQLLLIVAVAAAVAEPSPSALRGRASGRALMGGMADLSAMGLPFKKNAVTNILSSGNCDVFKLLALVPVAQELGEKLGQIKTPADAVPLLDKYGGQALGALCANPKCPDAIVGQLDPTKLPAQLTPTVLAAMSSKVCTQNTVGDGYCLVEAAGDALTTTVAAGAADYPKDPVTQIANGKAKICKSGCFDAMGKEFIVEMQGLIETIVGEKAPFDVGTVCTASTGGNTGGNTGGDSGNTGGSTGGDAGGSTGGEGDGKDDGKGDGKGDKEREDGKGKGITDEKWFLPAVIGGGCALVAALALAAVCLTRKQKKNAHDPESIKAPLTPRGETGAPVTQRV